MSEVLDLMPLVSDATADELLAHASLDELMEQLTDLTRLGNSLEAARMRLVAQLARQESILDEDGLVVQRTHSPGHIAEDTAALVSMALGCPTTHAATLVARAMRLTTVLPNLMSELVAGRIDGYRVGVVVDELELLGDGHARAVDEALAGRYERLASTPGRLRAAVRREALLADPASMAERAERARPRRRVARWVSEPGMDQWSWLVPAEQSIAAWAAMDQRAQALRSSGAADTLDQARSDALFELITSGVRLSLKLVVATSAGALSDLGDAGTGAASDVRSDVVTVAPEPAEDGPSVAARGDEAAGAGLLPGRWVEIVRPGSSEPVLVPAAFLAGGVVGSRCSVESATCDPSTGALLAPERARREPAAGEPVNGERAAGEPVKGEPAARAGYRPPEWLVRAVKARDGGCRFPGCSASSRHVDLDHVRPWPLGPTSYDNLVCLCRRHHRIKHMPGWTLRLLPDFRAEWTTPTGVVRTTSPIDHLCLTSMSAPCHSEAGSGDRGVPSSDSALDVGPVAGGSIESLAAAHADEVLSPIELRLAHRLEHAAQAHRVRTGAGFIHQVNGCRLDLAIYGVNRIYGSTRRREPHGPAPIVIGFPPMISSAEETPPPF